MHINIDKRRVMDPLIESLDLERGRSPFSLFLDPELFKKDPCVGKRAKRFHHGRESI